MKRKLDIQEHFIVPEGYFDNITEQIMDKLPEQDFQPMKIQRRKAYLPKVSAAAAAVMLLLIATTSIFLKQQSATDSNSQVSDIAEIDPVNGRYTVEDAADCAMIDKLTIYEMITE